MLKYSKQIFVYFLAIICLCRILYTLSERASRFEKIRVSIGYIACSCFQQQQNASSNKILVQTCVILIYSHLEINRIMHIESEYIFKISQAFLEFYSIFVPNFVYPSGEGISIFTP